MISRRWVSFLHSISKYLMRFFLVLQREQKKLLLPMQKHGDIKRKILFGIKISMKHRLKDCCQSSRKQMKILIVLFWYDIIHD